MTFPISVERSDGQFVATLLGAPEIRVVGGSHAAAIEGLAAEIRQRVEEGELLALDVRRMGVASLAGKYREDATLREICDDAYRQRDAEKPA